MMRTMDDATRERLRRGKAAAKRQGRHVHGQAPYGYRSVRGRLETVPELVPVVRRIFERAKEGRTPGQIARELTEEGIPTATGRARAWSPRAVRNIILNPAYAGERYGVKRAHERIVTRQAWNKAQAAMRSRARS
jgi:DNA invertase Pin-like site-specific DNA recombinase